MAIRCQVRVLIVDNDTKTRKQLTRILEGVDYHVHAVDGQGVEMQEAAKRIAQVFRPHVVIMDLRLAHEHADDRSGLDLWQDESFSTSRCILYSAYLNRDYKISIEALRHKGVEEVIGKEERPEKLLAAVERVARMGCGCENRLTLSWPAVWNEAAVIQSLYKDSEEIPHDEIVLDVLGRLFPESTPLSLKALEGTARSSVAVARGRAALFQAWPEDREPVVVKLARKDRIYLEAEAYKKHIQDRLVGHFYAQLQRHVIFWDMGGICYSFIGSSQKSVETFATFYRQTSNSREIIKPLEHFFEEVWARLYSGTHPRLARNLFSAYDSALKLRERMVTFPIQEKTLSIPGFPGKYPNPAVWIAAHEADSYFASARESVTHGDLHGDNLFIEKDHAWAIDFERTGHGHILRDFVELEEDIITRLTALPEDNLYLFYQLAVALTKPISPTEPVGIPKSLEKDGEIRKTVEVINGLRSIAHRVTRFEDMHEYYWGLLLDAFFSLKLADPNSPKWLRGLLLSSLLCTRLREWGRMWPTADWPFIDQYPVRHLEQIHNTKDSIEPKRLIAIPDAPNAQPLEYEYLRMLERAGQEIYWVKDGDHLVEINIRQLLRSVESEFHRRGSGGSVTNINIGNITIGDGANVGDIVLASEIQKSFNKAEAADIQTELKETLKQLAEAVNVMSNQLPGERAAEAVEDLTRLVEEATKPAPNRKWYSVSIEGLIKAADNVEKVGEPVINLSQKVFSILTGGIGST
jgi:CheY-like chemotaxis protein